MSNSRFILTMALGTSLLLGGCIVAPADPPTYYRDRVTVAPPAPRFEYRRDPPGADYLWIGGYWNWRVDRYQWVPGYWQAPRPGYAWEPHRWDQDGKHWRQNGGHWRKYDEGPPRNDARPKQRHERRDQRDERDERWNRR